METQLEVNERERVRPESEAFNGRWFPDETTESRRKPVRL